MRTLRLFLLAGVLVPGCGNLDALLGAARLLAPKISFRDAALMQAPSQRELSAYYCPRVLRAELPIAGAADLACAAAFGAPPPPASMQLGFDLMFNVENPNRIPLPLAELLTAVTLFPGASSQSLGAVCLKMCPPGDAQCMGGADPSACRGAPGDIKSLDDFPLALGNLLVAQGVGAAGAPPSGFQAPRVLAGANLDVKARLGFLPEALLPILEQLARQSMGELRAGRAPTFAIPYQLQGTVFGDGGSFGRVAAPYGPVAGTWTVPVERLLP